MDGNGRQHFNCLGRCCARSLTRQVCLRTASSYERRHEGPRTKERTKADRQSRREPRDWPDGGRPAVPNMYEHPSRPIRHSLRPQLLPCLPEQAPGPAQDLPQLFHLPDPGQMLSQFCASAGDARCAITSYISTRQSCPSLTYWQCPED